MGVRPGDGHRLGRGYVINARDWVITTRDAAGSETPPQLKLVRDAQLRAVASHWDRARRAVLPESGAAGAVLNCASRTGRRIVRGGGVALTRPASRVVAVAPFAAGASIGVDLPPPPGTYDLSMPYVSAQPIELQVVGHLKTRMPANLDRPGPRWPIGRVTHRAGEKRLVRIGMYAHKRRADSGLGRREPDVHRRVARRRQTRGRDPRRHAASSWTGTSPRSPCETRRAAARSCSARHSLISCSRPLRPAVGHAQKRGGRHHARTCRGRADPAQPPSSAETVLETAPSPPVWAEPDGLAPDAKAVDAASAHVHVGAPPGAASASWASCSRAA